MGELNDPTDGLAELPDQLRALTAGAGLDPYKLFEEGAGTLNGQIDGAGLQELRHPGSELNGFKKALEELRATCRGDSETEPPVVTLSFELDGIVLWKEDQDVALLPEALKGVDTISAFFHLDKERLLEERGIRGDHARVVLFVFGEHLARVFQEPLPEFETELFRPDGDDRKLLLLVCEQDVVLKGDRMAVLGRGHLGEWREYVGDAPAPLKVSREVARTSLHWLGFDLDRVTPSHVRVGVPDSTETDASDPIAAAVFGRLLDLSLVYSAGRTEVRGADWRSRFGSDRYVADVVHKGHGVLVALPDAWESIERFAKEVEWAYAEKVPERLDALQAVVGQSIQSGGAHEAYAEIVKRSGAIEQSRRWFWKSLQEDKLKEFVDQVREVTHLVEETTQKHREQVEALVKALSETMLAAVAVVLGTFIAALFEKEFSEEIYRIGVLVYAGYLIVFPGIIGLTVVRQQFEAARATFGKRKELLQTNLAKGAVAKLTGTEVEGSATRFRIWWWVTLVLYAIVAVALTASAWLVPARIQG